MTYTPKVLQELEDEIVELKDKVKSLEAENEGLSDMIDAEHEMSEKLIVENEKLKKERDEIYADMNEIISEYRSDNKSLKDAIREAINNLSDFDDLGIRYIAEGLIKALEE